MHLQLTKTRTLRRHGAGGRNDAGKKNINAAREDAVTIRFRVRALEEQPRNDELLKKYVKEIRDVYEKEEKSVSGELSDTFL